MASLNDLDIVEILISISIQFNRYFSIFIFLFGTIGNLLNCLVLSRPSLRSNPCVFLFLASSIANIISITFGLTTRILSGWYMDITDSNSYVCKFRAFVMFVSRTIAFWLITLATVDRWYSSCKKHQRRQMSSLKTAQRGTMFIIILSILLYGQVIYCYESNLISTPLRCYSKTVTCRLLTDITYACITVLCPLFIMSIFGFLTIVNIRQTYSITSSRTKELGEKKQTLSLTHAQRERWKRIDRYLRHVLFIQIIFLTILTMPQVIEKFYTTLTINTNKSLLHITIDKFIYNFVLLLTYLASGIPFYIYTLSGGSIFRRTLLETLQSIFKKITCRIS